MSIVLRDISRGIVQSPSKWTSKYLPSGPHCRPCDVFLSHIKHMMMPPMEVSQDAASDPPIDGKSEIVNLPLLE